MKTTMQGSVTKCTIGEPTSGQSTVEKILIVIGVIGAGKTALINAMVNYIFGVNSKDEFRFKIASNHNQIKTYTIYPEKESPLDFTLTIIDIPEFQDISGTEQIAQQIKGLFEGSNDISYLSGICIVTCANLPQSAPVNTYIFHSILSIFGNDLAGNIFMMVTSANHQYPPVITATSEASIPFTGFYKFDDSILYTRNDDNEGWSMNFASFQKFLPVLSSTPNVSLNLTKSVLQTYEKLQLKGITNQLTTLVDNGVSKLKELKEKEDIHQKYENDISINKDFTYQVKVVRNTRVYHASNQCVTVCMRCNYTCHHSCGYRDDDAKYNCGEMRNQGDRSSAYCVKCPGKCTWRVHCNPPYHYEEREEMETRVEDSLKAKYDAAQEGKTKAEREIEDIKQCLKKNEAAAISIINEVQNKLLYLDSIVLLPNSLTVRAHLLQLIKIETDQQHKLFYKQQEAILKAKDGVDCLRGGEDSKSLWYKKLTFKEQ